MLAVRDYEQMKLLQSVNKSLIPLYFSSRGFL